MVCNCLCLLNENYIKILGKVTVQGTYLTQCYKADTWKLFTFSVVPSIIPGNPYWRGRLSTVDLLVLTSLDQPLLKMLTLFTYKQNKQPLSVGQPYWAFPFSKSSLIIHDNFKMCCCMEDSQSSNKFIIPKCAVQLKIFNQSSNFTKYLGPYSQHFIFFVTYRWAQ